MTHYHQKIFTVVLTSLAFLLVSFLIYANNSQDYAYDKGVDYFNKKEWKSAIRLLQRVEQEHQSYNDAKDKLLIAMVNMPDIRRDLKVNKFTWSGRRNPDPEDYGNAVWVVDVINQSQRFTYKDISLRMVYSDSNGVRINPIRDKNDHFHRTILEPGMKVTLRDVDRRLPFKAHSAGVYILKAKSIGN